MDMEKKLGLTPKLNTPFNEIPDDAILTPEDISNYIGISVRQVRRYCESGKITSSCFGRKYIVFGSDFKDFLVNTRVRTKSVRELLI